MFELIGFALLFIIALYFLFLGAFGMMFGALTRDISAIGISAMILYASGYGINLLWINAPFKIVAT